MKLHGYLQDVLGNRTAAGLLRSLAKSPAEERTVRGLARDARTPVSSAARTVRSLEEKGIVLVRQEGRTHLVRPNMESYAFARVIAPAFRAEEGAFDAMLGIFRRAMRGAPRSVTSVAVFGSAARREETDSSDVDLLIISSAQRAALEFIVKPQMEAEAKFDIFISPFVMTKGRFRSPLNRNLTRSIIRDHVLVHGERLEAI